MVYMIMIMIMIIMTQNCTNKKMMILSQQSTFQSCDAKVFYYSLLVSNNHHTQVSPALLSTLHRCQLLRFNRSRCIWLSAPVRNGRAQLSSISVRQFNLAHTHTHSTNSVAVLTSMTLIMFIIAQIRARLEHMSIDKQNTAPPQALSCLSPHQHDVNNVYYSRVQHK